jgi:hypothetical protein
MTALDKLMRDEPIDPVEEEIRLTDVFARIARCMKELPGMEFHHLEPGEIGHLGRIEWNAWVYVRGEDRVFPFRVAMESGRHSQFRMRFNPDMGSPTDVTIKTALRDIMREQMTGVDAMFVRMRYWNDNREEPIRRVRRVG